MSAAADVLARLKADEPRVNRLRADFPLLNRPLGFGGPPRPLIYLDNANTTQKPRAVIDAVSGYYETSNANVSRAIHSLGEESTRLYEGARDRVRAFLNAAHREEIIFTKGTTEAINLVASTLPLTWAAGDEILCTEMEHHANLVPWQMAAERHGLVVKFLPIDDQGRLMVEALDSVWTGRTRLLAVSAMSNVLGTVNPVAELTAYAHARGVPVLVDGAQAVPHGRVDVRAWDCDFLAFSSHKVGGPTGLGVLYGKKSLLEALAPYQGGGNMIRSVRLDGFEANVLPYKFEAGTPHMDGAAGLTAALDYLEAVGLDWIGRHERDLLSHTMTLLEGTPGLTVYGTAPGKGGILTFGLQGIHAHDLAAFLDTRGIAVRAGHHCAHPLARRLGVVSTARASFWLYNTVGEAEALAAGVREAVDKL